MLCALGNFTTWLVKCVRSLMVSPQPSETHFEVDALFRLFLCSHLYPNVMTREESNLSFFTFHVIDAIRVLSVYWAKTDQVLGSSPKYYDGVCFSFSGLESSW